MVKACVYAAEDFRVVAADAVRVGFSRSEAASLFLFVDDLQCIHVTLTV